MAAPVDYFGDDVAATYDSDDGMFAPQAVDPAVDVLAALAGSGRALEFAIGTGRIALPLSRRGVRVSGIDLSTAMIAQLMAKPGSEAIDVRVGNIATTVVDGAFRVVYLVYNTVMNLTTQDAQVACFRNAARHLEPGGCFVIEVMVPQLRRLPPGQTAVPFRTGQRGWAYDLYDTATQTMSSNYVDVVDGRACVRSVPFRYAWPAELDLMARLAGMRLRDRWASWTREPFTDESEKHVSVWQTA